MTPKQAELVESTAITPVEKSDNLQMFERLAANPDVPVEKLERLLAMHERLQASDARADYYAAFARMQGELPVVTEKGEIVVNGQLRSKYARNEDIQEAVRPILQKHGFALSFRNEFKDGFLTITGILSHQGGHAEQDQFIAKADTSGSKNDIQALGSTRSYGQRYTTIALLNIATRGQDDDGQTSKAKPQAPEGFDAWWTDMQACADNGIEALRTAWRASKQSFRDYVTVAKAQEWGNVKAKAERVGK